MKEIAVSGSSGFVGSEFIKKKDGEYRFRKLERKDLYGTQAKLAEMINGSDVVMHFAGRSIAGRINRKDKKEIISSRVVTTHNLIEAMRKCEEPPEKFIVASATGIYNDHGIHTEKSHAFADHFLAEVVKQWEEEAKKAEEAGIKTVIMRMGVVLGKNGGIMEKMKMFYERGLLIIPGNGQQGFSFIHINDLVLILDKFIYDENSNGVYNVTAPEVNTYNEFALIWGMKRRKTIRMEIPEILLKMVLCEGAVVLTRGQKAIPERLMEEGYSFKYSGLKEAMLSIIN
ncbi:MAG: TIGR01777 family oxidoreductase [Bacteroidales bacterium]